AAQSTQPEDVFVDLFREVFGLEKAQMLVHEFPYRDFLGNHRFVDYALKTTDSQVAFEIDGPDHYNAELHQGLGPFVAKYEDDLLRQNSLVSDRWRVFRWTDRQLIENPEFVKEQLTLFLAGIPGLMEFDDFLPKQQGDILELRAHQKDALEWLERIRAEGKTIALLQHATGTGKTVVAIADAKAFNSRTLYLAHRKDLVAQTRRRFRQFWLESKPGLWLGRIRENPGEHQVLCASVQSFADSLADFSPESFGYVIIDEAHHALELGDRTYFYFSRQRVPEIRSALGVPEVTPETIKKLFFDFVDEMDMAASYKPVLLLAFLDSANGSGRARMADVVARFRAFYEERAKVGLAVERGTMRMSRVAEMSDSDILNVIVSMPLRKYQQRRYIEYSRDVAWLQFNRDLWKQCSGADLEHVRQLCHRSIERYYARLA
ncbi:MAG: DEAD/DEAH box helicase family protein, partial [Candidatus Omnitrophica bacterium]|nr:DEAD/DEAH box helicase family protein [Candidatus Omnitrophota bacterium]